MNKYDDVRIDVSQLLNEQNSKLSDYDTDITVAWYLEKREWTRNEEV